MKIAFLYTAPYNDTGIPIGLSYLIALAKRDHEVSLFETPFIQGDPIPEFQSFMEYQSPDMLGIHTTSLCLSQALKMVHSLKHRPITVWGGVGPTVESDWLNTRIEVDYVCVGPGEKYLMDLLGSEWDGELPIPDWSLFNPLHFVRMFKGEKKRWGNFQLSRGCLYSCSYCVNTFYHGIGLKPIKFKSYRIVDEIAELSQKYNLDLIRIFDECFGWHFGETEKFARLYNNRVDLPSIIETRPEVITPKMIEVLKLINCASVSLGIECGNEEQRKTILNRHVSNETIVKAFDLLHDAGIRSASYNIIGWPHDTENLIQETIDLNKRCRPDFINWFLASPFPGTRMREYCIRHDLLEAYYPADYGKESVIKNPTLKKDRLYEIFGSLTKDWEEAVKVR